MSRPRRNPRGVAPRRVKRRRGRGHRPVLHDVGARERRARRVAHGQVRAFAGQRVEVHQDQARHARLRGEAGDGRRLAVRRVAGQQLRGHVPEARVVRPVPRLVQPEAGALGEGDGVRVHAGVRGDDELVVQAERHARVRVLLRAHAHDVAGDLVLPGGRGLDAHALHVRQVDGVVGPPDQLRDGGARVHAGELLAGRVDDDVTPRQHPGEVGQPADVVEVVVAQEEVHLGGPLEEAGVLRVQEPAQAGARVEQKKARALANGEAGGLPRAPRHPAQRAEQCDVHVSSPSSSPACNECVLFRPTVQCPQTAHGVPGAATAKGTGVDSTHDITTADLSFDEGARDLWEPALPHLAQALSGSETAFLAALESAGRGAGLTQKVPIADLLDAYGRGSRLVREHLLLSGGDTAEAAARRLLALEHVALTRIAAGYSGGLGETIDRLRRIAEESSPLDVDSGAIKPGQLGERLSLEVERCQRMDLPLGLLELAVDRRTGRTGASPARVRARRPARGRRLPAREPAPLRQRRPHRRRRLRARPAGHQPARARGGGGAPPPRARHVRRSPRRRRRSSRSRSRTTTSWTRTRRRCSPCSAAACGTRGRRTSPSPGRSEPGVSP